MAGSSKDGIRSLTVVFRNREQLRRNYLASAPYGGLMVPTTALLRAGDLVGLEVRCAGDELVKQIRGAVLWCRQGAGIAVTAGVGFFASEMEKRESLLTLCSNALPTGSERQETRYDITLKVTYQTAKDFVVDYTRNLSTGGFYVESRQAPAVGAKILFKLYPPGHEVPIDLPGQVVWLLPGGRFGVRFTQGDSLVRQRLDRLVRRMSIDEVPSEICRPLFEEISSP